jgi:hypothetical protein
MRQSMYNISMIDLLVVILESKALALGEVILESKALALGEWSQAPKAEALDST